MISLESFKQNWNDNQNSTSTPGPYDQVTFGNIIRSRIKIHTNASFKYFWASFFMQLIVYALLSHLIVKYMNNNEILLFSSIGIILYVPFTIMLMHKFKRMARSISGKTNNNTKSLYHHILEQQELLTSFYRFKRIYEIFLIPLSSAIGVFLIFLLYVPGGISEHLTGASFVFLLTLASCQAAIVSENNKSFRKPIRHLQELLNEFNNEA